MSVNITGGHVRIKDGLKAAEQYAPNREVEVHLTFSAPAEGQDISAHIASVGRLAQDHVHSILHKKEATILNVAPAAEKVKAAPVKKAAPAPEPVVAKADPVQTAAEVKDALANDEWSDIPPTAITAPAKAAISDAQLLEAVHKANEIVKNPPVIRGLIATFNPDPSKSFQLREIAAEQRDSFLVQLADIVAAAKAAA